MDTSQKRVLKICEKSDLQGLASSISQYYSVKLSRVKVATALGYNSFNHALSDLLDDYIAPRFFYIDEVAEPLDLILEKAPNKGQSVEWVEKHSLPIEELYSHCKFRHFMTYSLIESNQSLPLSEKSYSREIEDDYEYDKELFKYLKDGIISDKLKQIIDED